VGWVLGLCCWPAQGAQGGGAYMWGFKHPI